MTKPPMVVFEGFIGTDNNMAAWAYLRDYKPFVEGVPWPIPTTTEFATVARQDLFRYVRARVYFYGAKPDFTIAMHVESSLVANSPGAP